MFINEAKKVILIFIMVVCPIAFSIDGYTARTFQQTIFGILSMVLVASFCRNVWMFLFFAWASFLVYLNGYKVGMDHLFNLFMGIMLFICARKYFESYKFTNVVRWMLIPGFLSILWMIFQHFGADPMQSVAKSSGEIDLSLALTDPVGLLGLKAHNGIFLTLINNILCNANIYLFIIMAPIVATAQSSMSILAFTASSLFMLYFHSKKIFIIALMVLIPLSGCFFYFKDYKSAKDMFTSRFYLWHGVLKMSIGRLVGYGPGSFQRLTKHKDFMFFGDQDYRLRIGILSKYKEDGSPVFAVKQYDPNYVKMHTLFKAKPMESPNRWDNPHNLYIQILFEYGVFGLFFALALISDIFIRFKNAIKTKELVLITAMLIVYFLSSLGQFPLYVAKLGFLFPILLGAFYANTERKWQEIV